MKPQYMRVGNEVILTRSEPIEELTAAVQPFAEMLGGMNNSFEGKFAYKRSATEIITNKHQPLYGIYNGGYAEIKINMDDDLVDKIVEVSGAEDTPPAKIGGMMWKMFKKCSFDVEIDDVESLDQALQDNMNGGEITEVFNVWNEILKHFKHLAKLPEVFSSLGDTDGSLSIYMPISNVGFVKINSQVDGFWDAFTAIIQESVNTPSDE